MLRVLIGKTESSSHSSQEFRLSSLYWIVLTRFYYYPRPGQTIWVHYPIDCFNIRWLLCFLVYIAFSHKYYIDTPSFTAWRAFLSTFEFSTYLYTRICGTWDNLALSSQGNKIQEHKPVAHNDLRAAFSFHSNHIYLPSIRNPASRRPVFAAGKRNRFIFSPLFCLPSLSWDKLQIRRFKPFSLIFRPLRGVETSHERVVCG